MEEAWEDAGDFDWSMEEEAGVVEVVFDWLWLEEVFKEVDFALTEEAADDEEIDFVGLMEEMLEEVDFIWLEDDDDDEVRVCAVAPILLRWNMLQLQKD